MVEEINNSKKQNKTKLKKKTFIEYANHSVFCFYTKVSPMLHCRSICILRDSSWTFVWETPHPSNNSWNSLSESQRSLMEHHLLQIWKCHYTHHVYKMRHNCNKQFNEWSIDSVDTSSSHVGSTVRVGEISDSELEFRPQVLLRIGAQEFRLPSTNGTHCHQSPTSESNMAPAEINKQPSNYRAKQFNLISLTLSPTYTW